MASVNMLETESPAGSVRALGTERLDDSVHAQLRDKQAASQLYESAYAAKNVTEQLQDKACNSCGGTRDIYGDPNQYLSSYARPYNQYQQFGQNQQRGNYMHNPAYRGYAQQYADSNCQSGVFQQPYTGYTQPYFGGYDQSFRGGYNQQPYNQRYGYDQQIYGGCNQNFGRANQQFYGGQFGGYGGFNQPFGGYGGYGGFNQPFGGYGGYGGFGRGGFGVENMLRYQASNLLGSLPYMLGNNNDGCGGYNQGSFGGNILRGGASSLLRSLPYMIGRSGNNGNYGHYNQFNRYR